MAKQRNVSKDKMIITTRVRLKPNKSQREILKRWFGSVRWTYNKSIESLTNKEFEGQRVKLSYALRNRFVTFEGNENSLPSWVKEIPKEVRKSGTDEASIAWKNKSGKSEFVFRTKKNKHQSLAVPKESVKVIGNREDRLSIYTRSLGVVKCNKQMLRKAKKKKGAFSSTGRLAHDSKITFNGTHYYIHIPYEISISENREYNQIVGLDPGVRSFLTGYSPTNIQNLDYKTNLKRIWELKRRIQKSKSRKERWKNENRLTDEIRSTHISILKELTHHFSDLVLGKFDSQKLTEKSGSKLSKKTRVEIGTLSHYKFRDRLWLECLKSGSRLRVVPEHFTSKTCGGCGELNQTLGASKTFECKECGGCFDRDSNAARNMVVKFLVASKV